MAYPWNHYPGISQRHMPVVPVWPLRPGVGFVVDLFKPVLGELGVNLRCRDIGMSQHFLDRPEVRPVLQQMSGKGMPEGMGGYGAGEIQLLRVLLDDLPKALPGKTMPMVVQEKGVFRRIRSQKLPGMIEIGL